MFALTSNITITAPTGGTPLVMRFVNELEIDKSRTTLTNTAKVTLPRKISQLQALWDIDINSILVRGAAIQIQLGYDGALTTKFTGYITKVDAKTPVTLYCEDEMWNLKQNSFTKSFGKGTKVADVVNYVYSGPKPQIVDLTIGGYVIKKKSTAQVLADLKSYGLQCYFDNQTLIVDFAGAVRSVKNAANPLNEVKYDFNLNIIDNSLEYKRKQDVKIKISAISNMDDGSKIKVEIGDSDGEEHTLNFYNMALADLQATATAELNSLKFDGYRGDFSTFGTPVVEPGYIAILNDNDYPEHNGSFLVEAVKTTFGMSGYRNAVTLERKLA